jgi:hypothetical protein
VVPDRPWRVPTKLDPTARANPDVLLAMGPGRIPLETSTHILVNCPNLAHFDEIIDIAVECDQAMRAATASDKAPHGSPANGDELQACIRDSKCSPAAAKAIFSIDQFIRKRPPHPFEDLTIYDQWRDSLDLPKDPQDCDNQHYSEFRRSLKMPETYSDSSDSSDSDWAASVDDGAEHFDSSDEANA